MYSPAAARGKARRERTWFICVEAAPHVVNTAMRNALCIAASVAVLVPGIHYAADYMYFHQHLLDLKIDDEECDSSCAADVEGRTYAHYREGYACVEVGADSFVCRPPRGYGVFRIHGDPFMQAAAPVSYGEIYVVPADGDHSSAYHIGAVRLADRTTDKILIDFTYAADGAGEVIHTAEMAPGDTYVECNAASQNVFHLVQYTGTFGLDGVQVAEFWAGHIWPRPPELAPCDIAETIRRTLAIEYDLGLPEYEEFERAFEQKRLAAGPQK